MISIAASSAIMSFGASVTFSLSASFSANASLRITNRVRRIHWTRPLVDANRAERARLKHTHELQPNHLEQRQKRDDEAAAVVDVGKEIFEAHRVGFGQPREQLLDADLHRNLLRRQHHLRPHLGAIYHRLKR